MAMYPSVVNAVNLATSSNWCHMHFEFNCHCSRLGLVGERSVTDTSGSVQIVVAPQGRAMSQDEYLKWLMEQKPMITAGLSGTAVHLRPDQIIGYVEPKSKLLLLCGA